jgi:hypothetical protein
MAGHWVLLLGCFVGLSGNPCRCQAQQVEDHLQPLTGYFASYNFQHAYYSKVRETLYTGLTATPLIRIVVLPSFAPEYGLYLEKKEGNYLLTYRVCKTNMWSALAFFTEKPKQNTSVATDTKVVELSEPLVKALRQALSTAIGQTRYPAPSNSQHSDGTTYVFEAFVEGLGAAGGQTWSPRSATKMGALVSLVTNLQKLAYAPADPQQAALLQQAQQLVEQLTEQ